MRCADFDQGRCASCEWITRPYAEQLAEKNLRLHSLLDDFHPHAWLAPVASPESEFRNKAKMAVLGTVESPLLGIVNHRGEAVSLCDCPLYPQDMRELLHRVQEWVRQAGIPPYQISKRKGELKFVLLTRSRQSGEFMLRFVLRSEHALERIRAHLPGLLAEYPKIGVVSANIQPVHMAVIEGEQEIFLTETTRLIERLNDVPLFIRPKSFFQTNTAVAERLYAAAREWAREIHPADIWDLFCGVGGFGLHFATAQTRLTGIEIEPEAIASARLSAEALGLQQVTFTALDSAAFAVREGATPDLVIVNPPRRGLGETLCAQLAAVAPEYIFYSSCNPETLVRDLVRLAAYQLERVQLFDMFPHTTHYEVLAMLSRR